MSTCRGRGSGVVRLCQTFVFVMHRRAIHSQPDFWACNTFDTLLTCPAPFPLVASHLVGTNWSTG